jgi:ABC-2 type transport system ATP-binding protein
METGLAIECRGLVKRYGDVTAVDGLDLAILPGECFGLLGPNGAGKTTTIEILEGLNRPNSGEVTVLGRRWGTHEQELRGRLGVSLQESRFLDKLTVFETLRLFRSFYRDGKDPEQALRDLSLEEKRDTRVMKLSGGQRQRLAVACALTGNPSILFLDEPTTGLDPQSRRQLWEHIREFRSRGGTIMLTTHYMEEAEQLCDRVAIVDHGKVIAEGTPGQLIGRLRAPHILEFSSDPPAALDLVSAIPGAFEPRQRGNHWAVSVNSLAEAIPALLAALDTAGARLEELSTRRAMLEDVFLALTGRELRDE